MTIVAALAVILSVSAAPAQAHSQCQELAGSAYGYEISVCQEITWTDIIGADDWILQSTDLAFGALATSATGCKITGWLTLDKAASNTWLGPKQTLNCTPALWDDDWHYYSFWSGHTSATAGQANVCVDLYYNNSSSSGWQRCRTTNWMSKHF